MKILKQWKLISIITIGLLILIQVNIVGVSAAVQSNDLTLSFSNLAVPGDDHYEGWVIVDGAPVSTGKFTVAEDQSLWDLEGNAIDKFQVSFDLDLTTKFVLSLEPSGDTDSVPSVVKPLAGDITNGAATLSHTVGKDLSAISGNYILATPSTNSTTDENSGVWFLDPTAGPGPGLDVPDLTGTDWVYEGWVVIDGIPVSTGTFDHGNMSDTSETFNGSDAGTPPFPGEDFISNAPAGLSFPTDLSETTIVISIEPRVDNNPSPFQFKPLIGTVPSNAADHTAYSLEDKTDTLATGSVTIEATPSTGVPFLPLGEMILVAFAVGLVLKFQKNRK